MTDKRIGCLTLAETRDGRTAETEMFFDQESAGLYRGRVIEVTVNGHSVMIPAHMLHAGIIALDSKHRTEPDE